MAVEGRIKERERLALLGDVKPGSGVICFSFGDTKILPVLITRKCRGKKEITDNERHEYTTLRKHPLDSLRTYGILNVKSL